MENPVNGSTSYRLIDAAPWKSWLSRALAVCVFFIWIPTAGHADELPQSYSAYGTFRYAMVHALAGVNLQDAKVAVMLHWSRHLENTFPGMESEFEILLNAHTAGKMVAAGKLHGLSLGIAPYLKMRQQVQLRPVFISSRLSTPLESYLLLVQKGNNWNRLADLPVRRLVTEKTSTPNIGQMWLETLLYRQNLASTANYFTEISTASNPARIVLPVFFGQADACLVPESAYQTMTELNPQLDRKLHVLARSPGLIKTIHCATELMPDHMVDRFIKKGVNMEDTQAGRQLLLIFHVKRNFVFQPEYMADSEWIYQEYEKLSVARPN